MLLKNMRPRLITINFKDESAKLLPAGPAVEVSDELASSTYAKDLIACGDIDATPSANKEPSVNEIKEMLDAAGIEYKANDKKETLLKLLG